DRIRQGVVQTRLDHAHLLAEAQHNPQLVRLDPEEPRKSPQCKNAKHEEGEAAAAQIAARQHAPQLVLTAAQYFFEIRRGRPRRLRPGTPRSFATRAPRPTAALIGPRHLTSPPAPTLSADIRLEGL